MIKIAHAIGESPLRRAATGSAPATVRPRPVTHAGGAGLPIVSA